MCRPLDATYGPLAPHDERHPGGHIGTEDDPRGGHVDVHLSHPPRPRQYGPIHIRTEGRLLYGGDGTRERVDRDSGLGDRYCATARLLSREPCTHLVPGDGWRYLHFRLRGPPGRDGQPKRACCRCCSVAAGCGALRPDWLKGATFEGVRSLGDNVTAFAWAKDGLQRNTYLEGAPGTPYAGIPLALDQVPNDRMDFLPVTYRREPPSEAAWSAPGECGEGVKSCGGTCRLAAEAAGEGRATVWDRVLAGLAAAMMGR